jgi:hypothetical protein
MWLVLLLLMVVAVAVPAAWGGTVKHDTYWLEVGPGQTPHGGGSGFENGSWYQYPTGWINQWFYNDPFTWDWKWIKVEMDVIGQGPFNWTINWSSPEWSLLNPIPRPPLPNEEQYVVRYPRVDPLQDVILLDPLQPLHIEYYLDLRSILSKPYNPEWVSIDVWGQGPFRLQGTIDHQCVPTPGAAWAGLSLMGLLAIGGGRRMARRRVA